MRITIGKKIIVGFCFMLIIYIGVFLFFFLPQFEESVYGEKDTNLKEKVEMVLSITRQYYQYEAEGKLTTEEAQRQAKEIIREIRYENDNYFWIDDTNVVSVLLPPKPETEGQSRAETKDVNGTLIVKELVNGAVANKTEGFYLDYWFPKMGETEPSPKRGYTMLFEPWGWVIGTGVYVDDVEALISAKKRQLLIINLSIMAVVFLGVGYYSRKFIGLPLMAMAKATQTYSEGDFRETVSSNNKDEIGDLAHALNQMAGNLKALIGEVNLVTESLSAQSQELAASSEEVGAATEEVASTTQQVSGISMQSAENANVAVLESEKVLAIVQTGNQAVKETVNKINSISNHTLRTGEVIKGLGDTSSQIGQINDVITGISDQTNLLALNAAIEAARAGEQGRGFAVVAEEVRKLAEQSSNASKEISQLIGQIQQGIRTSIETMDMNIKEVTEGVELATKAGNGLSEIVGAIEKNVTLIKEIDNWVQQANDGTQQLNSANQQITGTIQQITAAAQQLAALAENLSVSVSKFRI